MPTWWKCWTKTAETKKSSITLLDLSHQSLIDVPNDIFNHERTLEELYLNSNRIYDLPRQLFLCSGLKILNVCDNDLTRLPNAVQDLKNIHSLDLSKNAITVIPELSQLTHLNILNLSLNPLDRVPDTIYNTNSITELYLNDTNLTYIVANIGKLVNLIIFEIRENKLTTLPESISRLKKLKRLDVGQNELTSLPSSFGQITSLTELSLDLNYLEHLPETISKLTQLVHLDISFNNISNVEHINKESDDAKSDHIPDENFPYNRPGHHNENLQTKESFKSAMQTLYLNNNNLGYLPSIIFNMCNLTTVRVEGNFLTSISPQICKLSNLEELCLNSNNLTSLPGSLGLLKNLKVLMLDDNLLECLPKELSSCERLTILSIRNNKLTHLIPDLGHLTKLTVINVVNNRLRYLPVTLLHLEEIKAIWLSATQSKPLVPLQRELYGDEVVLTCVLLPQMDNAPPIVLNEPIGLKQTEHYAISNAPNKHINFALDCSPDAEIDPSNQKPTLKLNRSPTPYPKQLKQMAKNLKAGNKTSPNSEIKEARIITSLDSSNLDKFDSFVVYEQNVVIRQAKNTKSTDLLEKNYDNTDTESTSNCYNSQYYGEVNKELPLLIDSEPMNTFKAKEISDHISNELTVNKTLPDTRQVLCHDGSGKQIFQTDDFQSSEPTANEEIFETSTIDDNLPNVINHEEIQQNMENEPIRYIKNASSDIESYGNEHTFNYRVNKNEPQVDSIDGYSVKSNQLYDKTYKFDNQPPNELFIENNCHNYANRTFVADSAELATGQKLEPITNQNSIYTQSYEYLNANKHVPPPYHVARNYSKHAKYYDVLHSRSSNDNYNYEQFSEHPPNNLRNNFSLDEQANSPISISRSHVETPLSAIDDDRYSIQNFVDNKMQVPYVIKPKAHKLTTDHGDYHYVIQNKYPNDFENVVSDIPAHESLHVTHSIKHQHYNCAENATISSNDMKTTNENYGTPKHKTGWMFGQHKNVKVVDCTIYNIDFELEHKKNQGVFVKSSSAESSMYAGDKLLQIGEESVCQLLNELKETEPNLTKFMLILNQIPRPFQILVSRQS